MTTYKDVLLLVDKVSAPLEKIQRNTDKMRNKLGALQKGIKKVGSVLTALGATVAVVGGAIIRGANQVAEYGDRIDKMSQKIGMSRKSFQEWDYIMSQNGGNVETLQMGFKTLTTQIEGVQKGSKDSIAAFKALGVQTKDVNGQFRSADDIFNDSIRALQKIQNPTQKMILANRLFGRSATELRPLLNQEAQAVDNLRQKANDMGLIISDKDVENSVKFKDTMDTFGRFFQAKFAGVMMKLMPDLSQALEEIMQFTKENQEIFNTIGEAFKWVVTKALPAVIKAVIWVANLLRKIGGDMGNLLGEILSIPMKISMAFNTLKTNVMLILISVSKFITGIIEKIQWVIGKVPVVGKFLRGNNKVTQSQTNNNVVNNNNITNNYGNTNNYGALMPLNYAYAVR